MAPCRCRPAENIEILVHLARHNQVFGDLARMTLAGWDEKASLAAASDPQSPREVLDYFISPDNLRPKLLPALLENPAISEGQLMKIAIGAQRDTIAVDAQEPARAIAERRPSGLCKPTRTWTRSKRTNCGHCGPVPARCPPPPPQRTLHRLLNMPEASAGTAAAMPASASGDEWADDEALTAYLKEHEHDIAAEGDKPFQAIGGIVDLLGDGVLPVTELRKRRAPAAPQLPRRRRRPKPAIAPKKPEPPKRENALQKISHLDVKGRIQLALKGNKEERSLLIRDGTKVVALAVLEAPKLSDGEVEKFASQKNVLEAVLRQIPLKRRFMKNYKVVRNLVANPRTPLDLGLGLMKNLLIQDLKNISGNKEVSETIRKLALKMYKQKEEQANKK